MNRNLRLSRLNVIYAGNKYLRYYLVEPTRSGIAKLPEYKMFYQKKNDEVKTQQHKKSARTHITEISPFGFWISG